MGIEFWIAASVAAFFVGLGKGGVPVVTAMAVPVLSLVISPVVAAGILLPVFVISDVFGLIAYRRNFNRDVLKIVMVAMPIGVFIGWLTANVVSQGVVTLIVGGIGFIFALSWLTRKPVEGPPQTPRWGPGMFWGTITGFTSFVSHSGAAPYQVYTLPLRMEKMTFAGTMIVAFAYINAIKLIPYTAMGQINLDNLKTAALLVVPAVCAVWVGVKLVQIIPEKLFFKIIVWTLLLLSISLIFKGFQRL